MAVLSKLQALTSKPEQARLALGMIAIAALVIGVWQIRTSLDLTLTLPKPTDTEAEVTDPAEAEIAELQRKDSDSDGLSDYDEQYLYRTSAYLKDTDSDGYEDKTEVESGNDPLCPKGQECLRRAPVEGGSVVEGEASAEPAAGEIRALLQQQGATDEQLSQYDDASLLQLYQEVAGEGEVLVQGESSAGEAPAGEGISADDLKIIQQMSGSQIRELLIQNGASPDLLIKFSDDSLKSIILQSLGVASQ